jgi:hypothetical protein
MERDFYRDEFEQLLKDSTEDFKMYPSRKVWHSIYNDLHPDRKWPSLAVCLLLLTAILYVGVSNNNSINSVSRKNNSLAGSIVVPDNSPEATSNQSGPSKMLAVVNNTVAAPRLAPVIDLPIVAGSAASAPAEELVDRDNKIGENQPEQITGTAASELIAGTDGALTIKIVPSEPVITENTLPAVAKNTPATPVQGEDAVKENQIAVASDEKADKPALSPLATLADLKSIPTKDTREKEWIENHAFYNQPEKKKRLLEGYEGEFYLTPGVGYRVMFQNSDYKKINNSLVANNSSARYDEPTPLQLNQQIGLTMEMGGLIAKNISKRLRVKTGLQLNITDYITYAKKLDHPGQTMLALTNVNNNSIGFESRATNYANVPGENNSQLHNKTIQVSVPIGADYKLLGSKKLAWHLGGSIQPTYVASGYAYLVSADNNYFIEEQSMLRRWNVNGALESFVSIKTKDGARINLGPQFRYSLFSSYKNYYSYTEKPYSIGFKIGFSKSF